MMIYKIYLWYYIFVLYNTIYINCYSYLSTFEAYINNGKGLCLGDCRDVFGQKKCVYDWNAHELECKPLKIQTKHYRTIDNEECISNCGYFENESYQWCVLKKSNDKVKWNYCNRLIATKGVISYRTHNKYIACTDKCGLKDDNYGNWCYTIDGDWDYCYPDKKILLFNYINEANVICATPCELYTDNIAYCYDKDKNWKKCYLNPEYKSNLNVYSSNLKSYCIPGEYTSKGYTHCKEKIKKRHLFFNTSCPLDVEAIARDYEGNNPTVVVRDLDPHNIISLNDDPVHSYTVLPTYSYFGNDQINLPLVVRAIITIHTLRDPGERERFPAEIDRHFNNMGPNLNHVNYDERGHIIGSRLGGPTETYNIFPQAWGHNRGRMSRWNKMEADLDNFIRNNPNTYAEFTAILSYETDVNGNLVHRPTAIGLRVRLYHNNALIDMRGSPIVYANNTLENMYFTNNPDYSCIIEGDEIEDDFN